MSNAETEERFEQACRALAAPDKYWKMRTGELIAISSMDNNHLIRSINMCRQRSGWTEEQLMQWPPYKGLVREARKRKLGVPLMLKGREA